MTPILRAITALAFLLTPALAAQTLHVESGLQGWAGPVSNAALDGRIRTALAQARAYAPIPRVAFYDLAYPRDSAEAVRLHGRGVLVVTAFSQDSTELPLTSVYITSGTGTTVLPMLTALASRVSRADTAVLATFGAFRYDAVYLFPIALRTPPADLMVDFAAHRTGFRFARFAEPPIDELRELMALSFPSTAPPDSVSWALLKREYPDLAAEFGTGSSTIPQGGGSARTYSLMSAGGHSLGTMFSRIIPGEGTTLHQGQLTLSPEDALWGSVVVSFTDSGTVTDTILIEGRWEQRRDSIQFSYRWSAPRWRAGPRTFQAGQSVGTISDSTLILSRIAYFDGKFFGNTGPLVFQRVR